MTADAWVIIGWCGVGAVIGISIRVLLDALADTLNIAMNLLGPKVTLALLAVIVLVLVVVFIDIPVWVYAMAVCISLAFVALFVVKK